jgi:hypothetical protein
VGATFTQTLRKLPGADGEVGGVSFTQFGKATLAARDNVVLGGDVIINLDGPAQPEAARTLDNVFRKAFEACGIDVPDEKTPRRIIKPGDGTGRYNMFSIPDDKALAFADYVTGVAKKIEASPELAQQAFRATEFSLSTVNKIDGTKPFVQLDEGDECNSHQMRFVLHTQGVPDALAVQMAKALDVNPARMRPSRERKGRDGRGSYTGGRDVDVPMDAGDRTDKALSLMESYVTHGQGAQPPALEGGEHKRINRSLPGDGDGLPGL